MPQQGFASFRDLDDPQAPPPTGSVSFGDMDPMVSHAQTTDDSTIDSAVDHLSAILGTGFSLAAGSKAKPTGMVMATLGGVMGEATRQAIRAMEGRWDEVPPDLMRQAKAVFAEGVRQGGTEGFGRALGGMIKLFGRGIYRGAQKPPEVIRREFKTVSRDALDEGIPITRTGRGTQVAEDRLKQSGAETERILATAQSAGARPVNPRTVAHALGAVRDQIGDQPLREADLQRLQTIRDQFLKENPTSIPLTRAQRMKQRAQQQATQAYKLRERGAPVNNIDLAADEAIARGFREAIERRAPQVASQNERTQRLIGVARATERAEERVANRNPIGMGDFLSLGSGVGVGTQIDPVLGVAVGAGTTLINRPEIASRVAIRSEER